MGARSGISVTAELCSDPSFCKWNIANFGGSLQHMHISKMVNTDEYNFRAVDVTAKNAKNGMWDIAASYIVDSSGAVAFTGVEPMVEGPSANKDANFHPVRAVRKLAANCAHNVIALSAAIQTAFLNAQNTSQDNFVTFYNDATAKLAAFETGEDLRNVFAASNVLYDLQVAPLELQKCLGSDTRQSAHFTSTLRNRNAINLSSKSNKNTNKQHLCTRR